jgi:hypothetical protein
MTATPRHDSSSVDQDHPLDARGRAWPTRLGDLLVVTFYLAPALIVLANLPSGRGTSALYSALAPTAGALLVAVVLAMRELMSWASSFSSSGRRLVASAQFLPCSSRARVPFRPAAPTFRVSRRRSARLVRGLPTGSSSSCYHPVRVSRPSAS